MACKIGTGRFYRAECAASATAVHHRRPGRRAAATTVVAVLLAACGEGDDGAPMDVADMQASYGEIVRSKGTVLGVSEHGQVVREGGAGAWCVVDLDGVEGDCWPVDQRVEPGTLRWSPDGSMVAFDGRIDRMSGFDSDVRVLDIESGEIVTIADDGGDDPAGPQDLLPVWVDEDRAGVPARPRRAAPAGARRRSVAASRASTSTRSSSPTIVSRNAAVVDGDYTVAAGRDPTELVRIDDGGRGPGDRRGHRARCGDRRHEPGRRPGGRHQWRRGRRADAGRLRRRGRHDERAVHGHERRRVTGRAPGGGRSHGRSRCHAVGSGRRRRRGDSTLGQAPVIEGRVAAGVGDGDRLVLWSPASWQVVTLSG